MSDIWGNLLSGLIGGILGTGITSLVSCYIFRKQIAIESNRFQEQITIESNRFQRQITIESNRIFLQNILSTLQHVFVLERAGKKIPDEDINSLVSFKIIAFDDFNIIINEIDAIEKAIIRYNEGVDRTLATTETSHLEISSKEELTKHIRDLVLKIRELT